MEGLTAADRDSSPTDLTVADLPRQAAGRDADHPALVCDETVLRWGELDARIDRAASALRGLGLSAGDRVVLRLGNTPAFPICYFGALRAGLVAVPTNPAYTEAELSHLVVDSGAAVLVTDPDGLEMARRLRSTGLAHLVTDGAAAADVPTLDALLAAADPEPRYAVRPDDLAVIGYTSGTSGRPKGAMLTHAALLANLDQCARMSHPPPVTPADVVLLALPLFHIYGLNPGLGMLAWAGATGVLVPRFDPAATLALMARHRVTSVPAAAPMYVAWAREPADEVARGFASVRLALSGAAPLPTDTVAAFAEMGVTLHEGYGLTETGPVLTSTLMSDVRKPGSVGRPLPDVEVEIRDEQGARTDEDPGELVVRGPNLFSGYWPDRHGGPDASGWFDTGDVGYADDDGDLHLVDRRRELVLVSGFNVYPAEVEAALETHPAVSEAAVIGVPDGRTGEALAAYVATRRPVSEEELAEHCVGALARFKRPSRFVFVPDLPHSATGKVRKARLRELAAAARGRG